jgi:hypothetical protein
MKEPTTQNHSPEATSHLMGQRVFLYSGMVFLIGALVLFGVTAYTIVQNAHDYIEAGFNTTTPEQRVTVMISALLPLLFLSISAAICVFAGFQLLGAAGAVSTQVIPPKEHDLLANAISQGNEHAITQYIRLSSLSGMTGTFTKVGLTGLPLATIILTVVLAILGIFNPQFFDLAQLTLGAFLGSYVQKQSEVSDIQSNKPPDNGTTK